MNNSPQISILLVDENPRTKWEIIAALLSVGFTAHVVVVDKQITHRELLSGKEQFDVIVVDPFAFLGHGVEIISELRMHPLAKHIPMLVYSTCSKKAWGGAMYIPKPAHSAQLAGAILHCLPQEQIAALSPVAARAIALSSS